MFVLLGEFSPKKGSHLASHLRLHHWGRMWSRDKIRLSWEGELFGFDNGAYSAWRKGTLFPESRFLRRLDVAMTIPGQNCICCVCPDIVAGGLKSLEFSLKWRERLPDSMPWYLAIQDGMSESDISPFLDRFRGIFLGGTLAFKRHAKRFCDFAHRNGKKFHWGRCYQVKNVEDAWWVGADSIDSTSAVRSWSVGRFSKAKAWLRSARHPPRQGFLF